MSDLSGGDGVGELVSSSLLVGGLAFACCLLLTPLVRSAARRLGLFDRPDGARKLHASPVPRLGGVAVYLSFVLSLGAAQWIQGVLPWQAPLLRTHLPLLVGASAVMVIGLLDDLAGVSPYSKVLVQAVVGAYLYAGGFQISLLSNPFGETLSLGVLSLPVTIVWIVGMSNALNLIDGLDGLAAGIGLFATSAVFIAALIHERWEVTLLSAGLAGALFGFLRYNFEPASVFLGDCGSLFLGLTLAALAVEGSMKSSTAIAFFVPLLALGLPILDTLITVVRRVADGRRLFEPDTEHIHHRMLRRGLAPRRVVVILYAVAALFGALSLLTVAGNAQAVGLVVIVFSLVTWFGVHQLGYARLVDARLGRPAWLGELRTLRSRLDSASDTEELWRLLTDAAPRLGWRQLTLRFADPAVAVTREWVADGPASRAAPNWSLTIPISPRGVELGLTIGLDPAAAWSAAELAEILQSLPPAISESLAGGAPGRSGDVPAATGRSASR